MGKAEVGSAKYLSNKLKAKGLQRLRWYCQVCEKQMRDENGFRCHTQSESHVRAALAAGARGPEVIEQYSRQFERDFIWLLRSAHGTKPVGSNRFYNEYIHNRDHVHMTATRWPTLGAFVRDAGRRGLLVVAESPYGQTIAWADTTADAGVLRRELRENQRQAAAGGGALAQSIAAAQARADEAQDAGVNPRGIVALEAAPDGDRKSSGTGLSSESQALPSEPVVPVKFSFAKKAGKTRQRLA